MHGHEIIFDVENMQIGIVESNCEGLEISENNNSDNEIKSDIIYESSFENNNSEISSETSSSISSNNNWNLNNSTSSEISSESNINSSEEVETIIDLNGFKINLSKLNNTQYLNEVKEHFKSISVNSTSNPYLATLQEKAKDVTQGINDFFYNVKVKGKNYINVALIVIIILLSILCVILIVAIFYYKRGEGFLCFKKVNNNNIAVNNDDSIIVPNDDFVSKKDYQTNSINFKSTDRKVIEEQI